MRRTDRSAHTHVAMHPKLKPYLRYLDLVPDKESVSRVVNTFIHPDPAGVVVAPSTLLVLLLVSRVQARE